MTTITEGVEWGLVSKPRGGGRLKGAVHLLGRNALPTFLETIESPPHHNPPPPHPIF